MGSGLVLLFGISRAVFIVFGKKVLGNPNPSVFEIVTAFVFGNHRLYDACRPGPRTISHTLWRYGGRNFTFDRNCVYNNSV